MATRYINPKQFVPVTPALFCLKKWLIAISAVLALAYLAFIALMLVVLFYILIAAQIETSTLYWIFALAIIIVAIAIYGEICGFNGAYRESLFHTKRYLAYCILNNLIAVVKLIFVGNLNLMVNNESLVKSQLESFLSGSIWGLILSLLWTGLVVWFVFDLKNIATQRKEFFKINSADTEEEKQDQPIALDMKD